MTTSKKKGPLISYLMRHNIAKSEHSANGILIGVTIINFLITFAFASSTFAGTGLFPRHQDPTYIEDIPEEVLKTLPADVVKSLPSRNQPVK